MAFDDWSTDSSQKVYQDARKGQRTTIESIQTVRAKHFIGLELGIQFWRWILFENVGEELDQVLEPILLQQKTKSGSGYTIKIGDKTITYNEDFRFLMITTLPNLNYRIRRCLVPPLNDRDFVKLGGGGLDNGDFYFPQIYKKNLKKFESIKFF